MKLDLLSADRRKENLRLEHKHLAEKNGALHKEYEALKKEKFEVEKARAQRM